MTSTLHCTASPGEEYKDGPCEWCGNDGAVYADNGRCEQCDSDVIRCSICDEDRHVGDLCRHVWRDENWEWQGSGADAPNENTKAAFIKLLSLVPPEFTASLRDAVDAGRFHTWLVAPMIGGGGNLSLYGMKDADGRDASYKWGGAMIEIGEGDDAEDTAGGYRWLASLYEDKTPDANRITLAWIDDFLDQQTPRPDEGRRLTR